MEGASRAHTHLSISYKSPQVATIYFSMNVTGGTHKFWGLYKTSRSWLGRNKRNWEEWLLLGGDWRNWVKDKGAIFYDFYSIVLSVFFIVCYLKNTLAL